MNIYSIYKVTNISNGKIYIGYTVNLKSRMQTHKNRIHMYNFKFYAAIKKYGWDNFKWEEIYQSKDLDHIKNEMESYFIKEYDSYYNGYNSTTGGEGGSGRLCSEETRNKLSGNLENKWGKRRADEIKKILVNTHPGNNVETRYQWINSIKSNHASKKYKNYLPSGKNHHNYDHTLYTLENSHTKEIVTMTQREFLTKYHSDYSGGNFSSVIKGHRKSFRGWRLISKQS